MKSKITYELGHPTVCNLCGGKVSYIKSNKYRSGYMYSCDNCGAQVGTFPKDIDIAMGVLADSKTREKRIQVHRLFDRFWRSNTGRRKKYQKLAAELGIDPKVCHFAYMDMETLIKAEQILLKWWREKYDR